MRKVEGSNLEIYSYEFYLVDVFRKVRVDNCDVCCIVKIGSYKWSDVFNNRIIDLGGFNRLVRLRK